MDQGAWLKICSLRHVQIPSMVTTNITTQTLRTKGRLRKVIPNNLQCPLLEEIWLDIMIKEIQLLVCVKI